MRNNIIQNAIKIKKTGKILLSKFVHDCQTDFVDGSFFLVDGGNEYLRRSSNFHKYEELSLRENDSNKDIKNKLLWGTLVEEKIKYVKLIDCSTEHLENILKTQPQISELHHKIIAEILQDRKESCFNI